MRKRIHKYRYDFAVVLALIFTAYLMSLVTVDFELFNDRQSFENFINGFGVWGPIIAIGSIVLEVVVAPIPGFVPALSTGFIFGSVLGSIYTFIGNVIGTLLVFFLARKYGKPLIVKFFRKDRLEKYAKTINRHENYLLIFYFIPILPVDVITGAFGLSHIRFKKFFIIILLGLLFYSILITNFGDYLAKLWFF